MAFKLALTALMLGIALAAPAPEGVSRDVIDGEYIVVFHENSTSAHRQAHFAKFQDMKVIHTYGIFDFNGYSAHMTESLAATIGNEEHVMLVEENIVMKASQESCKNQNGATWGLVRTAEEELRLNGVYAYNSAAAGAGVDVYIIDTGIYMQNHDFGGRAEFGDDTVDTPVVKDDYNGHGTHVAGTVAGTNYGIAKEATVIAVKVLGTDGYGSNAGVIKGVEFACGDHLERKRNAKAKRAAANMSLGGGFSKALNLAVNALAQQCNVPVAVAAGNEYATDSCTVSPASAEGAYTVGSTDNKDTRSVFSNIGECVDVFAPGTAITSAWIGGVYADNTISGTSMASPHVAGVFAKILSADPSLNSTQVYEKVTSMATKDIVRDAGSKSPNRLLHASCA